ncbi:MAG TPA: glycosyltransferase [Propionicimonas sp.]|nr:glycosyltransferase [Propionicimonas sp.]
MKLPGPLNRITGRGADAAPATGRTDRRPDARPLDPAPSLQPFPAARYLYAVNAIPRNYAGRSSSIITKARVFAEQAGVRSTLVTFLHSAELADIEHDLRERGVLGDHLDFVCLHDYYPDESSYTGEPVEHPIDDPELNWLKEPTQPVYRYFDSTGTYRRYRRYDHAGRLIVQDHFNPNRGRTLREEFRPNGTLRRRVYMDLAHNLPRQEIHYRADQTPAFTVWWVVDADAQESVVEKVITFDEAGRPTGMADSMDAINHLCLDRLIGDEQAFVMVEDRHVDRYLLSYQRPHVRMLYVLHNAHIKEPYDDPNAIRPSFRPILTARHRVDAIVFLTATQRAEAEAKYGRADSFRVLPHSVAAPELTPGVAREPNLVVMMARLESKQKQVNHAIEAFAQVVAQLPQARLEIYGRGPEQAALQTLINDLGVAKQVKLMGFTKEPHLVYQRGALCILTSRFEGAPLTVQEAMSYGCPVVSYDLRYGPADVITDHVDGLLVPYGDRKAMAATVVAALRDPELLARMSAAAPKRAAEFGEAPFAARWSALFNEFAPKG